jgi:hypothetical protein
VAWVGPRSEVPWTRTGPHSRTHTHYAYKAGCAPTHTRSAHNMYGAHTRSHGMFMPYTHPRAVHTHRLCASPATASLTTSKAEDTSSYYLYADTHAPLARLLPPRPSSASRASARLPDAYCVLSSRHPSTLFNHSCPDWDILAPSRGLSLYTCTRHRQQINCLAW